MDQVDKICIEKICTERLESWRRQLIEKNATPVVLVAAGHGQMNGTVVICTVENLSDGEVLVFLEGATKLLREELDHGLS